MASVQAQPITNGVVSPTLPNSQHNSQATTVPNNASPGTSQNAGPTGPAGQSAQQVSTQPQQQGQPGQQGQQQQQQQPGLPQSPAPTTSTRPRDVRLVELLLTSLGVTSYEPRVPLVLLDFAYRHTSSVLTDALHQSYDPITTHAGSRPSALSGASANPPPGGDAMVSANAIRLAIASRLNYQYRGGSGGGGISREFLQDLAAERNATALPKVPPNEWGIRLPSERFVLSGTSWGLQTEGWAEATVAAKEGQGKPVADKNDGDQVMGGTEPVEVSANTAPNATATEEEEADGENDEDPGTMEDVFGEDMDKDTDKDADTDMMEG